MKITSLLTSGVLEFNDIGSVIKGVSPVLRSIRLNPGASAYLVETGEVLLSAQAGDIRRFFNAGKLTINDRVVIPATTGTVTFTHNFGFVPNVDIVINPATAPTMVTPGVGAASALTVTHNTTYMTTTITNTGSQVTLDVRLS